MILDLISIRPRQLSLEVQVSKSETAYLGEEFEIHVDVQNADTVELDVSFDIILHPGPENSGEAFCRHLFHCTDG